MTSLEKQITVHVHHGVHGRVATGLAQIARQYNVLIHILNEEELDCSSVLDVLSMGFASGDIVTFRIQGERAGPAMADVEQLLGGREE